MDISDGANYSWETDNAHANNSETMSNFIDCYLPDDFEVHLIDGSYAEIQGNHNLCFEVHASGNGDFNSHKVEFKATELHREIYENI